MLRRKKIIKVIVGQLVALGWVPVIAQNLPITADKSVKGAQPVVGVSEGVPIIQITPPSAGGVSHNRFTHFNVGPVGAVLNNSGGASLTQVAGQVAGNPMLGNKRAAIILNQVTAANPSQLQGMLEVAGHRAHVIIANPAGITCNGCGFLNASRATLTTGRPDIGPKGNVALDVAAGQLTIDGQGLDGTQVGQVDLLARALVLNAGVWADRLHVVAGAARIDVASGKAQVAEGQGPKPNFSLDTASIGGMYANSIRLIGTESGVGVNVGGNLVALTGDLTLTAAGDVRIAPKGTLSAKQKLTVNTTGHLDTRQATLHANDVNLTAKTLRNQKGSITSANTTTLRIGGELHNAGGLIVATGKNRLEAARLNNLGGTVAGGNLSLVIQDRVDNRKGLIFADHSMQLTAASLSNQDTLGASQSSAVVSKTADAAAHASPVRLSTGISAKTLTLQTTNIDNKKGSIQADVDLTLTSDVLSNHSGLIAAQRNTRIDARRLDNRGGTLSAAQHMSANVKELDGLGWLQSGNDLVFNYPGSLTPHGNFIVGRDLTLQLGGTLVNKTRLSAGRDLIVKADFLNNTATGELLGGRHTKLAVANVVDNAGLIEGQYTGINAWQIHNRGRIYGDSISLGASYLNNDAGPKGSAVIASRGNLKLGVPAIDNVNHSVLYAKKNLRVAGSIDAAGMPVGQADKVKNIAATIEAGTSLIISARDIHNYNGGFASETVRVSSKPKVYITPEGSTATYDAATNWFCDKVTRACSRDPHWLNDDPERRFLLPSKKYPVSRYGPLFGYAPYTKGTAGVSTPIALAYTSSGKSSGAYGSTLKEYFRYAGDSPIWAVFGVSPPSQDLPSREQHNFLWNYDDPYSGHVSKRDAAYESKPAYQEYKARHLALDQRIRAFNRDFLNRLVKSFTFYEVNEITTQTRAVRSDPGRIVSAGSLSLNGAVINDKSQIAAGGKLSVNGPAISNIGATGWRTVTREGQATFTQARSSDRKAHRSHYSVTVKNEPFDLPVGPLRTVLTPKILVPVRADTNREYGTLMAGRNTHINSQGSFINSGTIGAAQALQINALNIVNHSDGKIQAHRIDLDARESLTNLAALIQGSTVSLRAGQNINLISTTASEDFGTTRGTHLTGVSQVKANDLTMRAGNNIDLFAAQISVERDARLQAGQSIKFVPATVRHSEVISSSEHQRHELSTQKVIGSTATAKRDLAIDAGEDFTARAAELHAQNKLTVHAVGHVSISSDNESGSVTDKYREKKTGLLSSKTESTTVSAQWQESHASTLTGKNVEIVAGKDVTIVGSDIGAKNNLDIVAHGNIEIQPGKNQAQGSRVEKMKKSGLGAAGGMSVGASKQTHAIQEKKTGNTPSTLGSLTGDTRITATKAVNMTASKIVAPNGNVDITASQIDIGTAKDILRREESFKTKQTGVSVSISTPMLDLARSAAGQLGNSAKTDNTLIKGLAAAAVGLEAVDALSTVKKQGEADGASLIDKVGNVRASVQLGSSKQSTKSVADISSTVGAAVAAGKNLRMVAKGKKENAHINVTGSALSAGDDTVLTADGKINLSADYDSTSTKRDSKGSSVAIGVSASLGSGGAAFGVYASATAQKGQAVGKEKKVVSTKVGAGKKVTLNSGADTNIRGAVVSGETIVAKVGGNLNVESMQDTSSFKSKDKSAGGSATIGAGASVSGNVAMTKVNGNFASVREQSGLLAGDGGFDIDVAGNTNLKGAVISSTDEAVKHELNHLKTGSLTSSDIENHSEYKASSMALGASYAGGEGSLGPGLSGTSGKERSTTRSGISGAAITITDHETQRKLTGKTAEQLLAKLNVAIRTGDSADGLSKNWDPEKLRSKVAAEAEIISAFTHQAGQTIRSYADEKRKALRKQIEAVSTDEEVEALQKQINTLNMQERLMTVAVGVLTGSGGLSAVRAGLSQAADEMRQHTIADSKKFPGITDGETTLDNRSGKSAGIRGDGFNTAGVRTDLDGICGPINERCKVQENAKKEPILDEKGIPKLDLNEEGMVQFLVDKAEMSLAKFLLTKAGRDMSGFTGGIQGGESTLAGIPYQPGGFLDLIHEAFGGTHDFLGGTLSGLYDKQGSTKRGRTSIEKKGHELWSGVALLPSTPFGLSEMFSAEAWKVMDIILSW